MRRPGFHSPGADRRGPPARVIPVPELMTLFVMAEGFAAEALDEAPPIIGVRPGREDLTQFGMRVRDVSAESWPAADIGQQLIFGGFLNIARSFAHPSTGPEMRTACAPLLREAAKTCDRLLTLRQTALAQGHISRQGLD